MVFECQKDSYKSEFETKVVSCKECGPKEYEILLEDTILFPEGGGQVDCQFTNGQGWQMFLY